jgi:hypothetical protein
MLHLRLWGNAAVLQSALLRYLQFALTLFLSPIYLTTTNECALKMVVVAAARLNKLYQYTLRAATRSMYKEEAVSNIFR